jgi:hypothetical protein
MRLAGRRVHRGQELTRIATKLSIQARDLADRMQSVSPA